MTISNEIQVKIGEIKIGHSGDILRATLGSCVGIAMLWKKKNIFGLAHCLLPESPQKIGTLGAKFVSQAVPSMMTLLEIMEEDVNEIEVHVAGGGNMMAQLLVRHNNHIGILNAQAAQKYLNQYGFKIHKMDVGGDEGRQMCVNCELHEVKVLKLQSIQEPPWKMK
ncbi:MAG: chemotaxis protein CheD [Pseudobdellovibrionaceae bacterium]